MGRHQVMGWGYEGRGLDELLQDAERWGVTAVVDVRLNPISRKRGLSKTALRTALEGQGVQYVHLPSLGNPKDNRAAFAETQTEAGRSARARFVDEVLSTPEADEALGFVEELQESGPVLLLCFEASERLCHRALVIDALQRRARADEERLALA